MIEDVARPWLAAMVDVSVQFTVLAGLVAVALQLSRRFAPNIRYIVWLFVLLRLAIPVGLTSPLGTLPAPLVEPRLAGGAVGAVRVASGRREATAEAAVASTAGRAAAAARDGAAATSTGFAVSRAAAAFLIWGGGVLILTAVQVLRAVRRRARTRAATALPPGIERRIGELRREIGLRREVDIRVVADGAVAGPAVEGFLGPRILLPASLVRGWRNEDLDAVLLHELVHVQRWDPAARAVGNLLQVLYFFHPLVWWVGRRLEEAREQACDDAVVRRLQGGKRVYIGALLPLVEERSVACGTAGLGIARSRRPLAMRLKRMLRRRYDPAPRARVLSLAALGLGVALALALSTEARVPQPVESAEVPRLQVRPSWRDAFLTDAVDEVDNAGRVAVGGDFTIGRAATSLLPDLEALAARDPALIDRLDALGQLRATLIVDQNGAVRRVRFAGDVDEALRQPFREVLNAARFDPTTHFERGAAIVEVQVDYYINPAVPPRSLYESGQLFEGDEVAEVLPDLRGAGTASRYAAVRAKGQPPALDVGDGELILSFFVSVDAQGDVESVSLFHDSRTDLYEDTESTAESERLAAYVESFRFEPVRSDGAATAATLLLDLRVSRRIVEVATRRGDEEAQDRLAEIYRLREGRSLDLRPPPHAPERMMLYRTHAVQARMAPGGPDGMTVVLTDDRPTLGSVCFGCDDLLRVLSDLGVRREAVRFEGGAENVRIVADIVKRAGASRGALLDELPRVLRERFDLDVGFQMTAEPSRTLVLRGTVGVLPPAEEFGGRGVLHVFTDRRDEPDFGAGGLVSTEELVGLLAGHLQMPVVDETSESDREPFLVQLHDSAYGTQRLDLLIQNVESQTDLEIAVEERLNEVVIVSRNPS